MKKPRPKKPKLDWQDGPLGQILTVNKQPIALARHEGSTWVVLDVRSTPFTRITSVSTEFEAQDCAERWWIRLYEESQRKPS